MPRARKRPSRPDIIRQIASRIPERKVPEAPLMPVSFVETWAVKIGPNGLPVEDEDGNVMPLLDASGRPIPGAQERGVRIETVKSDRGSRSKRRYRLHILEIMGKARVLSARQVEAGLDVYDAWCATQLSPPAIPEIYVDASRRPDDIAVAQVAAMQAYADLMAMVPRWYRAAVRRTACDRLLPQTERDTDELRRGLTALARELGY